MKPIDADTFCKFTSIQKLRCSAQGKLVYLKILPDAMENRYRKSISIFDIQTQILTENILDLSSLADLAWLDDTSLLCCSKEVTIDQASGTIKHVSNLFTLDICSGQQREYIRLPYDIRAFSPVRGADRSCIMSLWLGETSEGQALQNGWYTVTTGIPFIQEGEALLEWTGLLYA